MPIETDEMYINNEYRFCSFVSDHHCFFPGILVAKGTGSFEVERWCWGLWCVERPGDAEQEVPVYLNPALQFGALRLDEVEEGGCECPGFELNVKCNQSCKKK